MYFQRFGAGYTILNNAYYGQSGRAGFKGRPSSNTYWRGRNGNGKMLALPSTQNTLHYDLGRPRNDTQWVNNASGCTARYGNSYTDQGYKHSNIGPCRICGRYGHLQRNCESLNERLSHVDDRHNSESIAVLNYVKMVDKDICVHYYTMTMRATVGDYTFGTVLDSGCNKSNVNWELVKKLQLTNAISLLKLLFLRWLLEIC